MDHTARPMNQRTSISLNGKWDFKPHGRPASAIDVPDFWDAHPEFSGVDRAVYERDIVVPDAEEWRSKIVRVEFEGVNFLAAVSADGRPLARHVGGWIPFDVDVTPFARPGGKFRLAVEVEGGNREPIVDAAGGPRWADRLLRPQEPVGNRLRCPAQSLRRDERA
ncbi:MAG: hypothetical protein JXD23_17095 [Spirochaetales bacterium]|nr:hypothetical protein [Spirochaetales bacterium]